MPMFLETFFLTHFRKEDPKGPKNVLSFDVVKLLSFYSFSEQTECLPKFFFYVISENLRS